jgi:hypothetical protein
MSGAVYQEDPYQHIVGIEVNVGRIFVIASISNYQGISSVPGITQFHKFFPSPNEGQLGAMVFGQIFDPAPASVSVSVPDMNEAEVTVETVFVGISRERFDAPGTLEERVSAAVDLGSLSTIGDDFLYDSGSFATIGSTFYTGPIATFNVDGFITSTTGYQLVPPDFNPELVTTTYDPPI